MPRPILYLGMCLITLTSALSSAFAQGPPGQTRLAKVRQAYNQTRQYQADTRITITRNEGDWFNVDQATLHLAFDRPSKRIKIDSPDFLLVSDGTKLRARSPRMPGQHLEVSLPSPMTYRNLADQAPMLTKWPVVDAIFLVADKPIAVLSEGAATSATPRPPAKDDKQSRPRLQCAMRQGQMTLRLNPETWLIERATLRVDMAKFGGQSGDSLEVRFDIDVTRHNQPIDDKQFEFDTSNSTPIASWGPRGGGGAGSMAGGGLGGGGGAGQGSGHPLIGQSAPDFTLVDLDGNKTHLADVDADVIVLTFWASWAPPCREVLPALAQVEKWAQHDEDKPSVQVLTINTGQPAKKVQTFCEANDVTLPVLLDDFTVAEKYGMVTVPHTAVVVDDKIRFIHSGPCDDYLGLFKDQIQTLLKAESESGSPQSASVESQTNTNSTSDPPTSNAPVKHASPSNDESPKP